MQRKYSTVELQITHFLGGLLVKIVKERRRKNLVSVAGKKRTVFQLSYKVKLWGQSLFWLDTSFINLRNTVRTRQPNNVVEIERATGFIQQ